MGVRAHNWHTLHSLLVAHKIDTCGHFAGGGRTENWLDSPSVKTLAWYRYVFLLSLTRLQVCQPNNMQVVDSFGVGRAVR
jgi:hypothetical protein